MGRGRLGLLRSACLSRQSGSMPSMNGSNGQRVHDGRPPAAFVGLTAFVVGTAANVLFLPPVAASAAAAVVAGAVTLNYLWHPTYETGLNPDDA